METMPALNSTMSSTNSVEEVRKTSCTVLITEEDLTAEYGEYVLKRLEDMDIAPTPMLLADRAELEAAIDEATRQRQHVLVHVGAKHVTHQTCDVHVQHELPEVHLNMPLKTGLKVIEHQLSVSALPVEHQQHHYQGQISPSQTSDLHQPIEFESDKQTCRSDGELSSDSDGERRLHIPTKIMNYINMMSDDIDLKAAHYDHLIRYFRQLRKQQFNKEFGNDAGTELDYTDPSLSVSGTFYYPDLLSVRQDAELVSLLCMSEVQAALEDFCNSSLFQRMVDQLPIPDSHRSRPRHHKKSRKHRHRH